MSNSIESICKILKVNQKKLLKVNRKTSKYWDSLAHLEIMFIIEKNIKKKISAKILRNINKGIDIIKLLD